MRRDILNKWVTALRSGEYKQTKGYLHDSHGMCCLGVLCDLYSKEHPVLGEWVVLSEDKELSHCRFEMLENYEVLPEDVQEWANMKSFDGSYTAGGYDGTPYTESLAALNDKGYTFNDLADIIEERGSNL
jgi:hypothetical protein